MGRTQNAKACVRVQEILKERKLSQVDLCYLVFAKTGKKLIPQHVNAAINGREEASYQFRRLVSQALGLEMPDAFPEYDQAAEVFIEWFRDLKATGRIDVGPLSHLSGVDYTRLHAILRKQDAPTYWERQKLAALAQKPMSELFPEFEPHPSIV
jgi:hypothetical protein